jgi:hypothetical protein
MHLRYDANSFPSHLHAIGAKESPGSAVQRETKSGDYVTVHAVMPCPVALRRHLAARNQARRVSVIARKNDKRVKLYSRPGNDLSLRFPLIVEALSR